MTANGGLKVKEDLQLDYNTTTTYDGMRADRDVMTAKNMDKPPRKAFLKKLSKSMTRRGKRRSINENIGTSPFMGSSNVSQKVALLSGYYSSAMQQRSGLRSR